jgi:cysteine desulfurase / selenocysteine lyase
MDIRKQFPIFQQLVFGKRLAYLDSAATAQKPQCVIDSFLKYYSESNANVHRGVHYLSEKATLAFEEARNTVKNFINAKETCECIFVKGGTDAINLVAHTFGEKYIAEDDEILISAMEHHSNIVPWQMLCQRKKAKLKIIPMNLNGELDLANLDSLLNSKTKLLAITHVSNALGTVNPIKAMIEKAHAKNIKVLVDGAQSAAHLDIDVQDLDCDFFTFSGHKVYGPTGIGVLYGKADLLRSLPPYQGGGEMILKVTFAETIYNDIPYKFEAGTPAIAGAIALGQALKFMTDLKKSGFQQKEVELLAYATESLKTFSDINIIGNAAHKVGVISFTMDNIHPHDIATILDQSGVAIRAGHHCAMPVMDFFDIPGTARISLGVYNTEEDIDQCIQALKEVKRVFKIA